MARTPGNDAGGSPTAKRGQRRPTQEQRVPESEALGIVLTPDGQRRLVGRAAWLATEAIPMLAHNLDDPDQDGRVGEEYQRAVTELARLTSILGQATTTEELPPEDPRIVELGDEVVVEFAAGDTERFLVVDPVEAPLGQLRISVRSPLARALVGRRVGDRVDVHAPAGLYRCRIVATGRHRTAAAPRGEASGSWVTEGGMGRVGSLPISEDPQRG
jgi:transcription elongation factor GreA